MNQPPPSSGTGLTPIGKRIEDINWNQVAKSEAPGRHQTTVVTYLKKARQHLQDENLRKLSPIEASEKLPATPPYAHRLPVADRRSSGKERVHRGCHRTYESYSGRSRQVPWRPATG
ncbi:hypothetical protein HPB48_008314 [Haemaphysalis longicornis]|uniref:Uncharacterized protein n=1 Tax=Haemaphysalis longicornis TaxID=44386 RepID=A0A9J6FSS5_HAELO|nr:hypothetical protein HPB48_008314 [Haemaphysalis longicornis]